MRKHISLRTAWSNALFLILMGVFWILFAPVQLGGHVSYIIVHGTSMLPGFRDGDLVLLRRAAEYPVGTISTYRYPKIGPVIHRVVGREGLKYVMKGDNNSWTDGYQPVIEEIMGGYWMHLPGVGNWVIQLRSPLWFALLAGSGTLLLGLTMQTNAQPQKRFQQQTTAAKARLSQWAVSWREGIYTLVFGLALVGCLLLLFGWARPVSRQTTVEIPLAQTGSYSYSASMPPGVYDQNRLENGSTIFPQLNCAVRVFFNYSLTSQEDAQVEGTHLLAAVVRDTKGWKRSLDLQNETHFTGARTETNAELDLCAVQQMIADMQAATGVQETQYQLAVYPQVKVKGSLGPFAFQDQFNEPLIFVMEPRQVYVQHERDDQNRLARTQSGLATGQIIVDNTLPVLSLALPVRAARILGLVGLLLAGLGFWWVERAAQKAEASDLRRKVTRLLGHPPVRVHHAAFTSRETTPLEQLDDLIALAQQTGAPVLYTEHDQQVAFLVELGGTLYRCEPVPCKTGEVEA